LILFQIKISKKISREFFSKILIGRGRRGGRRGRGRGRGNKFEKDWRDI